MRLLLLHFLLWKNAVALQYDAVIIGSGIGGLSCGATLASQGKSVCVLEAHEHLGGAAHEWERKGYRFESGPSLYAGLSLERSPNPLRHVFQVCGEEPEWIRYDRWGFSEAKTGQKFAAAVGSEDFIGRILPTYGGPKAIEEWGRLMVALEPLGSAVFALPPAAVREDPFALFTLGFRYFPAVVNILKAGDLSRPFSELLDDLDIKDEFIRNWLDMLCFLLQGATTKEAPASLMAYMLSDFYRPNVFLDYPVNGTRGIVDALVRGCLKGNPLSKVRTKSKVEKLVIQDNTIKGVRLSSGEIIHGKHVISNADLWSTSKLVDDENDDASEIKNFFDKQMERVTPCDSFLHLHLGIDATDLPTTPSEEFPAQWAFIDDWQRGVDAPRNMVLVSVASLLDKTLAPTGKHVVHAYVPATEPFDIWDKMTYPSKDYRDAKTKAVDILFEAIEQYIPDVRQRIDLEFSATPKTHERFLRKHKGTYGAFLPANTGELLMGHKTPLTNFWLCGDSTFPGIGVPAVAASGLITANSILNPIEHWRVLDKIRL